ncbi:MAG: 4Fe-4S binding protein [Planctomycetes bacterium]|nr:4Fe-4S binding protein [Planctomycetota bacterium]
MTTTTTTETKRQNVLLEKRVLVDVDRCIECRSCVAACPAGALRFADERHAEREGLKVIGGRALGDDLYKRR